MKHLVVADGCLEEGVPIHQPLAATDESLAEELEERRADGRPALLVEREPDAIPVAATAEIAKLAEDSLFVLLFPSPDPRYQCLAAEVVTREFLLLQKPPFDDRLGGNSRVVGAGHPERPVALHPPGPHEDVLERVVEGVAEVEGAGHVRRRDHQREHPAWRGACRGGLGMPGASRVPERAAAGLSGPVVVVFGEFGHGGKQELERLK